MSVLGRRVFGNILALGGAQLVTMAAGVVTAVVLARALGPALYGILGFGVAVLSYLGLLVNMGMDVHGVREIARRPTHGRRLVDMIVSTRLLFAAALFGALVVAVPYFGWSDDVRDVLIIQGIGLFAVALTVDFFYQAEQRMSIAALRQGGAAIIGALAVILLVAGPEDLRLAAAVPIAVHVASAIALLCFFRATTIRQENPEGDLSRMRFVGRSAPVALMGVLMTIYINMDIIILGYMVPEAEVGLYVAASRVTMMAIVLPNLIHSAFLPALSKAFGDDRAAAIAAGNHARSVVFFGGAVGGAGMLLAPAIIELLFGAAYAGANWAMTILMAHVLMFHLTAAFGTPLLAWQCDKPYTAILAFGAVVNLTLNFALIPKYGIEGAAVATLATQILIWLGLMILARKAFNLHHFGLMARILILTAVAMAVVYGALYYWPIPGAGGPWLTLFLGGGGYLLVYGGLAIAGGVISPAELHRLIRAEA